jgi:hypothetical protein
MKKASPSTTASEWLDRFLPEQPSPDAMAPAFQPNPSRSERKAQESTRVAREVTEAATEQRESATARLRGARLRWEADARALAATDPKGKEPKKKTQVWHDGLSADLGHPAR